MKIRILEEPDSPWGDYGRILYHGMTCHLPRTNDGRLQLERTAPFVPPISFPGISHLVVTNECKRKLETAGLAGFGFQTVSKARIVDCPWHNWGLNSEEPLEYPETGEPKDYILRREHSPVLATSIGELWEIVLTEAAESERRPQNNYRWDDEIYLVLDSWSGADIFLASGVGYIYVSERAQKWFMENYSENVRFRDCLLK